MEDAPHLDQVAERIAERLVAGGFVAASDEARELLDAAADADGLEQLVQRRLAGEPLAWLTGSTSFCDLTIRVHPGVYVPRWQSEPLALRAVECLPQAGVAVDLCTGSGAIARVLRHRRTDARIVASDVDPIAVACAKDNGVDVFVGDLFSPLPSSLAGTVDLVVSVPPYVPTAALTLLPRDTFAFEAALAYDGGADGLRVVRRILHDATRWLRPGGTCLLEVGGGEAELLAPDLDLLGYRDLRVRRDEDGDVRGVEVVRH